MSLDYTTSARLSTPVDDLLLKSYNGVVDRKKVVASWLNKCLNRWEEDEWDGQRQKVKEFARHLDVSPANLSRWMNAKVLPTEEENISKLAAKCGGEIYVLLSPIELDPDLIKVIEAWPRIPSGKRTNLANLAQQGAEAEELSAPVTKVDSGVAEAK